MNKNKEKLIDISIPKFLVIVLTVLTTFVLPAQLITVQNENPEALTLAIENFSDNVQTQVLGFFDNDLNPLQDTEATSPNSNEEENQGRVAGESTTSSSDNDGRVLGVSTDIRDESTQFMLLGAFFLMLSLGSLVYLFQSQREYKKSYKPMGSSVFDW